MKISLALAERCEAVLMIGRSPGADRELAIFEGKGLPVYWSLAEVPRAGSAEPSP